MKKERIAELEKLNTYLLGSEDFVQKIGVISTVVKDIIGADRCTIFIYDKNTDSFWSAHIDGVSFIEVPGDKGLVSEVFKSKKYSINNNVYNDKRFYSKIDKNSGYITHSILAAPIISHSDQSIGAIQLLNKKGGERIFTPEDVEVLQKTMKYFVEYAESLA